MDLNMNEISQKVSELEKEIESLKANAQQDGVSLIVFSNSLDKLIASLIIATGAAANGFNVCLFFTFWGISALRKDSAKVKKTGLLTQMFGWMLPKGSNQLPTSQMNFMGIGPVLIKKIMKDKQISSLEELIETAGDLGVNFKICEMSMDLLGMKAEEMINIPNLEYVGVSSFLNIASKGKVSLFI